MKRKLLIPIVIVIVVIFSIVLIAMRPGDQSQSCLEFYAGMENPPAAAYEWCQAGEYFTWEIQ